MKNIISVVHRTELFEPEIARHHGRIFKLMGDGLFAEFGSQKVRSLSLSGRATIVEQLSSLKFHDP